MPTQTNPPSASESISAMVCEDGRLTWEAFAAACLCCRSAWGRRLGIRGSRYRKTAGKPGESFRGLLPSPKPKEVDASYGYATRGG